MGAEESCGGLTTSPTTLFELYKIVDMAFEKEMIQKWYRDLLGSKDMIMDRLTHDDSQKLFYSVFANNPRDFVDDIFRIFDPNNDGYVDFKEFIVGVCVYGTSTESATRTFRWAFRMYDTDGTGEISREEVTIMFNVREAIFKIATRSVSNKGNSHQNSSNHDLAIIEGMVDQIFKAVDRNGGNKISEFDFINGTKQFHVMLPPSPMTASKMNTCSSSAVVIRFKKKYI